MSDCSGLLPLCLVSPMGPEAAGAAGACAMAMSPACGSRKCPKAPCEDSLRQSAGSLRAVCAQFMWMVQPGADSRHATGRLHTRQACHGCCIAAAALR